MGFGFGGLKLPGSFKTLFSPSVHKNLLKDSLTGGLYGPYTAFTGKGDDAFTEIHKGLGNLVTGGYIAQKEANDIMKKNAKQAQAQYEEAQRKAEAEAARIANLEEEKRRRLANYGNKTPQTLLGTYLGVSGPANVSRPTLG